MTNPRPATQFFLFKLLAPRPSFAQDMNEQERAVMLEHVAYWKGHANRGVAVVFGPVLDPKGTWGVGIVEVRERGRDPRTSSRGPGDKRPNRAPI